MSKVLIVEYSLYGHIYKMAEAFMTALPVEITLLTDFIHFSAETVNTFFD